MFMWSFGAPSTRDSKKSEHGRKMIYAGCPYTFGLGMEGVVVY